MRFSVDAHAIGRHLTGNEVYVRNLMIGFAALDKESEFIAYLSSNVNGAAAAVPERFRLRHVSPHGLLRLGVDLSRKLREDKPDLVHVQYTAPFACPVPIVVSVHDISYIEHPEYFKWPRPLQLRMTVKRTIERAVKVITPSEASKQAMLRNYKIDDSKIDVVPIAVSPAFRPIPRDKAVSFVNARFRINAPFVVTVGDLQPRKNHIGLIRSFERLIVENPSLPHHLVIVGQNTWFADRVKDAARNSKCAARIHFTDFVNDSELLHLYNASEMVVFPSFYEGFGLPILEGMACGRAVATSNTSSMPEVADAAALLFDPKSDEQMAGAMRDLLVDTDLRTRMERLGHQRASQFTWERTAQRTLDVYYSVAGRDTKPTTVRAKNVPALHR